MRWFTAPLKQKKTDFMCGLLAVLKNKSLQLHTVQSQKDIEEASNLLYREYYKRNYCQTVTSELHFSPYMFLEESRTFVLKSAWKTIGTMSLFADSDAKLPIDSVFPDEVERLRQHGYRLGEVGLLALDTSKPTRKGYSLKSLKKMQPLFALIKITANYAEAAGVTHLVITVHPKHRELYEYLNFKPLAKVRDYDRANGNPALAMVVAVEDLMAGRKALELYFKRNMHNESTFGNQISVVGQAFRALFPESYHSFVTDRKSQVTVKEERRSRRRALCSQTLM